MKRFIHALVIIAAARGKKMCRYLILALPLFVLALSPAHAEPKTITVENCAKVTTEIVQSGERKSVTVKCTGEAFDPHVRENNNSITLGDQNPITLGEGLTTSPLTRLCYQARLVCGFGSDH